MSQVQFDENSTKGENQGAIHDICDNKTGESVIHGVLYSDPDADAVAKFLAQGEMACH
jgi:hypothetical protein